MWLQDSGRWPLGSKRERVWPCQLGRSPRRFPPLQRKKFSSTDFVDFSDPLCDTLESGPKPAPGAPGQGYRSQGGRCGKEDLKTETTEVEGWRRALGSG